jgi:NDP-sugar pyrophosphorylase family protein
MENKIQSIQIFPSMPPEKADVLGVVSFSFEMQKRLAEKRDFGKKGWHMPLLITEEELRRQYKKAIKEDRFVDVGVLAMMLFHRKRMENFE